MNPFDGLAKFALGLVEHKTLQNWLKLLFELACSGLLSFLLTCGASLGASCAAAASRPYCWPLSVGSGMVVSAICMTVVFRRSPLTKGMLLVLPEIEAENELKANVETISR